ncbi:aromatic acid decarboxylase, partial [Streptomyces sp. SID11385]|nr:aromatic acid decarboxylase [Streptomyces sp. SID11385]
MPRETGRTHENAHENAQENAYDTPSGEPRRPDPARAARDALGAALGDRSDRSLDTAASLLAALPATTAHALLAE